MKLVAGDAVRRHVEDRGGVVYIWPERTRCCRATTWSLEAGTIRPDREVELVHTADGVRVYATIGLLLPNKLELNVSRRGRLRAFWNGQGWIG